MRWVSIWGSAQARSGGNERNKTDPLWHALWVSVWLALLCNWPLWRALSSLIAVEGAKAVLFMATCALALVAFLMALQSLWASRRITPALGALLLIVSAPTAYFMQAYNVVIDRTMMVNTLQTDWRETRDLINLSMLGTIAVLALVPLIGLWRSARIPTALLGTGRRLKRNLAAFVVSALVLVVCIWSAFGQLAPVMREHKHVRYLVNPANVMVASLQILWGKSRALPLVPMDVAPRLAHEAGPRIPVLILVVGETARADRFSLNGYARVTNPKLAREDVVSFKNVASCGTNTADSVPCMFSLIGRENFLDRKVDYENLLDVLQRSGYAVQWLDNNSGCKGVCARIPSEELFRAQHAQFCGPGGCMDEILTYDLNERIHQLAQGQATQPARSGVVLVLHQMGSHGPAYYKRSPEAYKAFKPECTQTNLQQCDMASIGAAYDNSIVYTDHVLAQIIDVLKRLPPKFAPGMLYVSDHGESLGEKNLYLHGMPYTIAPKSQKHVPMIAWLSDALLQWRGMNRACIKAQSDKAFSHDNLSHSILELLDISTKVYRDERDIFEPCESPGREVPHAPRP